MPCEAPPLSTIRHAGIARHPSSPTAYSGSTIAPPGIQVDDALALGRLRAALGSRDCQLPVSQRSACGQASTAAGGLSWRWKKEAGGGPQKETEAMVIVL